MQYHYSKNKFVFFCFSSFLFLAYIWGVVSFQHFLPSGSDFYLNTISSCILALSFCVFFVRGKIEYVSLFSILLFVFFALVLLQPLLNNIAYVDSLVISSVPLLLCGILSLVIVNLNPDEKTKLIEYFGFAILFSGVFTVFTQFVQVLNIEFFFGKLVFYTGTDRPVGNIGQVNQASFVSAMSIATAIYIFLRSDKSKYRNITFASLIIFWLSMGLGFSASRGGILFGTVAILSTGFFYKNEIRKRILFSIVFIPVFVCGYLAGTELLQVYMNDNLSAVNRLVNGNNFSLRFALLQEAWLAFSKNPITGVGWGQLISFGLENAQQVKWFTVAHHSHNIVAQIAAEMGLLGLLPLLSMGVLILRKLSFKMSYHHSYVFCLLLIIGLYSLSEYPLWHVRFLILTVFLVSVIDTSRIKVELNYKPLLLLLSIFIFCGSVYYIHIYNKYKTVAYLIRVKDPKKVDYETKFKNVKHLPDLFGYSKHKEMMLYLLYPIKDKDIDLQIKLGNRVLSHYLADFMLIKQANLNAVAGRTKEADKLYKAACLFEFAKHCDKVVENLKVIAQENPNLYKGYHDRFLEWHKENFRK